MEDKIIIHGAKVHNLKNISLEIPHNKLIVITGVSGSGKSSLAFDTIFAEGQRRYIESLSPYARQFLGQMKPADVDEIVGLAPAISIDQKALSHNPRSTVGTLTEIYDYLRVLYARLGEVYCPHCGTKIAKMALDEMLEIILKQAKELKVNQIKVLAPLVIDRKGEYYQLLYDQLALGYSEARIDGKYYSLREQIRLTKNNKHSIDIVIDQFLLDDYTRLSEAIETSLETANGLVRIIFLDKSKELNELLLSANWTCPNDGFAFPELEPRLFSFNSPHGACSECHGLGHKEKWVLKTKNEDNEIEENRYERVIENCLKCHGKRLNENALSVSIGGKNLAEITSMSLDQVYKFFVDYYQKMNEREKTIGEILIYEIIARLDFLLKVGISYLTLDRNAETLSGGEAQRIRLASQIGSRLSHTLYVLDEPTIGLHERDTERLIDTLKSLRDQNNTVIIVEHDERTIRASDFLIDLGPYAGRQGGEITAIGEIKKLLNNNNKDKEFPQSLTLKYLRGDKEINFNYTRRIKEGESIKVIGAKINNLKNINVEFPLRKLVAITGVSGSGKSTLMYDVLYQNLIKTKHGLRQEMRGIAKLIGSEYINKVVIVDQSSIGRTPRSNPATYTGIFTPIREFFANLPAARERAYTASRFSFNRPGGRCEACDGAGFNLVEMHFLPPVLVECEVCRGKRFNRETLQVKYKNKNIAEVLQLTIDEAIDYFDGQYLIIDKLKVLSEVGLGYLQLGQSATTLSGGEAQRIKLARELTHTLGAKTLYLLDEPSVGLHYYDIELLLQTLNKLINRGNSVILIEHNMHIIKEADWIIDLGPEGGDRGGKIVACGTPEQLTAAKNSITGDYLRHYLK